MSCKCKKCPPCGCGADAGAGPSWSAPAPPAPTPTPYPPKVRHTDIDAGSDDTPALWAVDDWEYAYAARAPVPVVYSQPTLPEIVGGAVTTPFVWSPADVKYAVQQHESPTPTPYTPDPQVTWAEIKSLNTASLRRWSPANMTQFKQQHTNTIIDRMSAATIKATTTDVQEIDLTRTGLYGTGAETIIWRLDWFLEFVPDGKTISPDIKLDALGVAIDVPTASIAATTAGRVGLVIIFDSSSAFRGQWEMAQSGHAPTFGHFSGTKFGVLRCSLKAMFQTAHGSSTEINLLSGLFQQARGL